MGQLGSTLKRLFVIMADNYDMDFPFLFTKIYIANSFWYLVVSHIQAWNLCYVPPLTDGRTVSIGEAELVVTIELQMGWCKPTPFSCAVSETAR